MAEGFARKLGGDLLDVYSAGTNATGVVSEDAIEIMREVGVDISRLTSNGLEAVPVEDMDIVISMAPVPARLLVPKGFQGVAVDWKVQDPVGRSLAVFRRVRDEIHVRVTDLVDQLQRGPEDVWRAR